MSVDVGQVADQGIERRRFIQGAVTVAWATPLILTLSANRANAQAASCLPNGGPCDACGGMNCCDEDGPEDGGCCCSDAEVEDCAGVCVAVDADCATMNTGPETDFVCWVPGPVATSASARGFSSKGPKG